MHNKNLISLPLYVSSCPNPYLVLAQLLGGRQDAVGERVDLLAEHLARIAAQVLGIFLADNRVIRESLGQVRVDDGLSRKVGHCKAIGRK